MISIFHLSNSGNHEFYIYFHPIQFSMKYLLNTFICYIIEVNYRLLPYEAPTELVLKLKAQELSAIATLALGYVSNHIQIQAHPLSFHRMNKLSNILHNRYQLL
jgi:hypothetical protein